MSSVSAAPSAAPSASSCANADFTVFPVSDVACSVISTTTLPSNTSESLSKCCKSAPVESWNDGCGFYCLSVEQSVADLQACFMENGVRPGDIRCNSNNTATATGRPDPSPTTPGGRAAESSGSSTGPSSQSSTAAAAVVLAPQSVSKAGLGMLGMIVVSIFAGVML